MDNKIMIVDNYLNPERWEQMTKLAESLVQSGAFPKDVKNGAQALVKMQAGIEMGLLPMQSITGLTIINGVVSPWGRTIVKVIRDKGWSISYETHTERGGGVTATVTKGDEEYSDTLYFDMAEKSKWTYSYRKDRSGKYVKDANGNFIKDLKVGWYEGANRLLKLRYGALSMIIKTYIPEVLGPANDIAEIAEDYIIEETEEQEFKNTTTDGETIIISDDKSKSTNLSDFIKKEKEKSKNDTKVVEINKKVSKTDEKVEEAEIVEETPNE